MKKLKSSVSLIISILLAVLAFIFGCFFDPLKYGNQSSLAAIPAFLLSIVILLIGQIISIQSEIEKVSDDSNMVCETVKNYLQVTKMGTPKSAWKYIVDRLSVLEYIQNTSFNFNDELDQTQERLYSDERYKDSFKEIAYHIKRGIKWRDIGDETAKERFRSLNSLVAEKTKGEYSYKFISHTEPQIGFILLTYIDGTREVLFNWDFRNIPQDPVVLLSRDETIFNMFAAQYADLWRAATEDYDNIATKSTS